MSEREIKLPPINRELARRFPNKARYAQLHMNQVIPEEWFDGSIEPYKNTEEVYAACLEKGVTWQELLHYKLKEGITL